MNPISPIITPFRWYSEFYQQTRYQNDCDACEFKLIMDKQAILPFQFKRVASGYPITKWLMRPACKEAKNKLLTPKDSLFGSDNNWTNNGGFVYECSNVCTGTSVDQDELTYAGALTIGKTYTLTFIVNDFQAPAGAMYYKVYNGATFVQNITTQGLQIVTFTAVHADLTFQLNIPGSITDEYICFSEVQITQAFQQESYDIELEKSGLLLKNYGAYDYIIFCSQNFGTSLPTGEFYCIIEDGGGNQYYSEVFTIKDFFFEKPKYYILQWLNSCDIGDVIYKNLGCTYVNRLFLDEAVVSKPEYPYKEEGEENGEQVFTPTFQKWEKRLNLLVAKCPEYIVDSLTALTLHDGIDITMPIRKKQEFTDGVTTIKSAEVDIQPIMKDCFTNVEIKLLLNTRYVDSSCCVAIPAQECAPCDYTAGPYGEYAEEIGYAMVDNKFYQYDPDTDTWNSISIPVDTVICSGTDEDPKLYIWTGSSFEEIPTITSSTLVGDVYSFSGYAWPDSYCQMEYSLDGGSSWVKDTQIVSDGVFQFVGIDITSEETEIIWRMHNFNLACDRGYSNEVSFGMS